MLAHRISRPVLPLPLPLTPKKGKTKKGGDLIKGYIRRQFRFVRVTLTVRSLKTRKGEEKKSLLKQKDSDDMVAEEASHSLTF